MTQYDPAEWSDLFVACAGAAAALAGLLFVAVSINLENILKYPELPARALESVVLLVNVLVVSIFGLVPDPGRVELGVEVLVVGAVSTTLVAALLIAHPGEAARLPWRILTVAPGTVLFLVGGISLVAESGGGLDWVLAAVIGAFLGAALNAWVLLVEILR